MEKMVNSLEKKQLSHKPVNCQLMNHLVGNCGGLGLDVQTVNAPATSIQKYLLNTAALWLLSVALLCV